MIAIIDYGSGNVDAIMNILREHRIDHVLTADADEIARADRYILPGVGAFDPTMRQLLASGLAKVLNEEVIDKGKKVLGICVGMQLFADGSDEGEMAGLGWIGGQVRGIDAAALPAKPLLPHMGWNSVTTHGVASLFDGVDLGSGFYFLHSFYFDVADPGHVAAKVTYGNEFPCAVERGNIFGMQFHPEKSHSNGACVLTNFARLS